MVFGDVMTIGMRRALTDIGARELRTPEDVDAFMAEARTGVALLAVNSACGCAGGGMRPGIALALQRTGAPDHFATVFAGQDVDATARAREYIVGHPPSSPCVAIFRDGELAFMLERERIQGRTVQEIADDVAAGLTARTAGGR